MSILEVLAEGGQTWAHRMRMVRQVIKMTMLTAIFVGIVYFGYKMQQLHEGYYQTLWYYCKAILISIVEEKVSVNTKFWAIATQQYYSSDYVDLKVEKVIEVCENLFPFFWKEISNIGSTSLLISLCTFSVFILFFIVRGSLGKKRKHLSGKKVLPAWRVALKLKLTLKASPIKIGRLPLVKGTETQHILISGGTGSGKTNAFHHLLPQIRESGQRAVIVDTTGVLVSKYYRKGKDIILNPFDERGVAWHPWVECRRSFDYDSLAQSFIPLSNSDHDNYWRTAASTVFSAILQENQKDRKTKELAEVLLCGPLIELCQEVKGTKGAAHLDIASEKTAASIRSVAMNFLSCDFLIFIKVLL